MLAGTCKSYPGRLLILDSSFFHPKICHAFMSSNSQHLKPQTLNTSHKCIGVSPSFWGPLHFSPGDALLWRNHDNWLVLSKQCLTDCRHFHSFNAIVTIDWMSKRTRLECKKLCGDLIAVNVFSTITLTFSVWCLIL